MTWELVDTKDGQYAVDWDVVGNLIRQHELAKVKKRHFKTVDIVQSNWYNPFSWSMPPIVNIEIDWTAVRTETELNSFGAINNFRNAVEGEGRMRREAYRLRDKVKETAHLKGDFLQKMREVQGTNARNVDKAVDDYQSHIDKAKFVRNTSGAALMVGATFLSGGTAVAVIGAASGLKGVAKYQDTGKVGAAVMEATGNFVFGVIPLKAKAGGLPLSKIEEGCLVVIEASWETGIGLAEGKTFAEALGTGALKLTGPGVDKVFGAKATQAMLGKVPVPMNFTLNGKNVDQVELLTKQVAAMAKQQVDKRGGDLMTRAFGAKKAQAAQASKAGDGIVQSALNPQEALLNLAIVKMDKGVGRGW